MVYYSNLKNTGLTTITSEGDGYSIKLSWHTAFTNNPNNKIAYNIYYSTFQHQVFKEGPKFLSFGGKTKTELFEFTPGQLYHFGVRAIEYDPNLVDPTLLPTAFNDPNLGVYPETLLASDITATATAIPLLDAETFPSSGIVRIGVELINYTSVNYGTNTLNVPGSTGGSAAHLVDQGGGHFYLPGPDNVGDGYINGLTLINQAAPTETWTIKCVFVQHDGLGNPIAGTAKFAVIGSISGEGRDGYGNPIIWQANNITTANSILSFAIQETSPLFVPGDVFIVKVKAITYPIPVGRGFYNTIPRMHDTDGYDGYETWSPIVSFILAADEELNDKVNPVQSHFEFFNYQYTEADGYHQITKDILTTDLTGSDVFNTGFAAYDYAGWHRTDPTLLLSGDCVGSYIGGQQFCADGYNGVGMQLRGLSIEEQNNQRQEILLNIDGEPVVLIKRQWTGITCECYMPSGEYPDDRCARCFGTKFVVGWDQFYNPRRSDGRILVRFSPADDIVKQYEAGLESEMFADVWTLVVPTVKQRDIIVRFDQDGNEEFRYEIINVNRNKTVAGLSGGQHFKVQRIRKTDVAYQIPVFRNTRYFPQTFSTGVATVPGIPPHTHDLVISENFPNGTPQLTTVSQGHNHYLSLINGVLTLSNTLGHSHAIVVPPLNPNPYIIYDQDNGVITQVGENELNTSQ